MAAVAHAHIRDAALARLFNGFVHGEAGRHHADGFVAVDDRPRRAFRRNGGFGVRLQAARLDLLHIAQQVFRAVREHAERIGRHQHVRDRARVLRAHPDFNQRLLGKIMQFVDSNRFHKKLVPSRFLMRLSYQNLPRYPIQKTVKDADISALFDFVPWIGFLFLARPARLENSLAKAGGRDAPSLPPKLVFSYYRPR